MSESNKSRFIKQKSNTKEETEYSINFHTKFYIKSKTMT